jgi:hypothetical protein
MLNVFLVIHSTLSPRRRVRPPLLLLLLLLPPLAYVIEIESKIPPYPFALPPLSSSPSSRIGPWWEGAWVDYQRRGEGHLVKGLAMGREEERDKK